MCLETVGGGLECDGDYSVDELAMYSFFAHNEQLRKGTIQYRRTVARVLFIDVAYVAYCMYTYVYIGIVVDLD